MKFAYIMSRFPKLTETFVLDEIVALRRLGVDVDVYPLLRTSERIVHKDAMEIGRSAHFHPFFSWKILRANWTFLRGAPSVYCKALAEVLAGTWGSANFFIGALAIFPKSVSLAYEMRAGGITHVHAHFANHPTVAALIIHRLTDIPFSFTAHGHDVHVERRMLGKKMAAAQSVVTISEYNRRLMLDENPEVSPDKVHVIHCGVDTELFGAPVREEQREGCRAVAVGSLLEVKGHRYVIEACRLLRERGVSLNVDFIGEGPLRAELEELTARSGLSDTITFHGELRREEVVQLVSHADLICQASVHTARGSREGIPVSLMEGMAVELPVVASRISGIPELVEDGRSGRLVPPGDPLALADGLEELVRDPALRQRFGRAGRARVLADFDLERNVARKSRLFASVAPVEGRPSVEPSSKARS